MKTLLKTIQELGNVNVAITNTNEQTIISIKPNTVGIKDPAANLIEPFRVIVNENDTEEEVCELISTYVPQAVETVNSIKSFEDSIKKAEEEKAANKKEKEEKEKLEKEEKEKYSEIKKLLESDDPDKFETTKLLNKFKTTYKTAKLIMELQDLYDKKFNELTLF